MRKPERLMTYNVKYGEKLSEIFRWFESLDAQPKVACFQEFPDPDKNGGGKELETLGYDYRFGSAIVKSDGTFGQLTAVSNEGRIESDRVVDFGLNAWERSLFRVQGRRSALVTNIDLGDQVVEVANGHWALLPLLTGYQHRLDDIDKVIEEMNVDNPRIILGDFNNIHINTKKGRNRLIRDMKLRGFDHARTDEPTFPSPIAHYLDFIFSDRLKLSNPRVEKVNHSDHKPVFVDIRNGV